jgi:hypothetical protein
MIPFYVCVLPAFITSYCSEKFSVLFSGMLLVRLLDKKALLQLSPSQQGKALVLHTGHW